MIFFMIRIIWIILGLNNQSVVRYFSLVIHLVMILINDIICGWLMRILYFIALELVIIFTIYKLMRIIYFSHEMVGVLDRFAYTHPFNIMPWLKKVHFPMSTSITILIINCIEYLEKVPNDPTAHACSAKRVNN